MKRFFILLSTTAVLLSAIACNNNPKALLPNVSGKAGEVIIAMDRENWEAELGNTVRDVLGGDTPYLAQKEPLFSLVNVSPSGFADLFRVHRNIVIFNIDASITEAKVLYKADLWAHPQCVIQISAPDSASMLELFNENCTNIISALEQAERDRIIENAKLYEEYPIAEAVTSLIGGSPHFPSGYKLRKMTDDFIWIDDTKQYSTQGVFIYKYPACDIENFSKENIIANRNEFLRDNVPGMFDNTWMTTSTFLEPTVEFIRFRGRQFTQTRGFWEVQNDFMGGPFVSHSFYGPNGKDIIVIEAWVYAPRYDKRQYLRQVESIIYSFEWSNEVKKAMEL